MGRNLSLILFIFLTGIGLLVHCKRPNTLETDPSNQPLISKDSIIFDTVFTTIGTTTEFLKLKNPSNKSLEITRIELMGGENSNYRLAVDGEPGDLFSNVVLRPKDSIYLFVEATIDPNGGNTPLVVEDKIEIETLGTTQSIALIAWGQDAIYHRADTRIAGLPPFVVLPDNEVWTSEKPHVIFGYAVVDSARSLRIEAGTQVHFHNGSGLWIYKGGHLVVNGTADQRVVFQGDRLEGSFDDATGQWDRIWINEGPSDHLIRYALIKNGLIGLQTEPLPFDVDAPTSSNKLILENVIVQNHSGIGLLARNYQIDATNVVFGDGGTYSVALTGGGNYTFKHITLANYFAEKPRTEAAFFISNVFQDVEGNIQVRNIENLRVENSIIFGNRETEIEFSLFEEEGITNNISFHRCLVKTGDPLSDYFTESSVNQDPAFVGPAQNNFDLESNSFARNRGSSIGVNTDVLGRFRDFEPDLGAYEYID